MKPMLPQIAGSLTSSIGAITAWQEHVDWFLRVGASAVAIVAGIATLLSLYYRKNKKQG